MTELKPKTGMAGGQQMRFTDQELATLKGAFKDNDPLLKLLRKVFLPELDPNAPLGQMIDIWMATSTKDKTPEQIAIELTARNMLIQHVDGMLMQMKTLANLENLTKEEVVAKVKANSAK